MPSRSGGTFEYDNKKERLDEVRRELEDPAIASDGPRLLSAHAEMVAAQEKLDALYERWAELEKKSS